MKVSRPEMKRCGFHAVFAIVANVSVRSCARARARERTCESVISLAPQPSESRSVPRLGHRRVKLRFSTISRTRVHAFRLHSSAVSNAAKRLDELVSYRPQYRDSKFRRENYSTEHCGRRTIDATVDHLTSY